MSDWSSFKDGIEYEDIRKFFLNKCKELGLKSKYRNNEITFEDVDSYDYFMGDFSNDGVLSIYYPFTLKKEYFMSNFEDYDEFLAQFVDVYDSAMIEKRLRKTESKKSARKSMKESSNKKVSDFENTNTKFVAIMDIEDFYDEDGNTSVLWQGKSSDLKKSNFYDFTVLETETYDKVLYLFVDIAEF